MSAETGEPLPPSILPGAHAYAHRYWRRRILWAATITYAVYYLCRVNISIAIPFLQRSLGYSKTELGMVASSLQVPNGLGKFLNGLIADRTNPRYFMAAGLLLSGVANIAFSASAALPVLALVWALNGWFQSMGFPSGAESILLHSKSKSASEVVQYLRAWTGKARFVLVPTNYPDLIESAIEELGKVGMVIYGNHSMRAAIKAVRDVLSEMRAAHGIHTVGDRLATLEEVFSLQKDFAKPETAREA
jgi:hypothetical protein